MLNSGLNNSIIRGFGRRIFSNGMNFWGENNFTYVTNCDFSDGFSSCIIYGDGAFFDNTKVQNTYLANNHMHHFGYRIVDDIGGFFFGQHPPGNVVDHNLVHDSYVHNYCGNGIYSDTGSNGAIVKNNLVYDVDNAAWNMNGMEHEIFNNIFAYSGNKASHGETRDDHDIMSFHNNILYLGENDGEVASGSFTENSKLHFENNLYWREDKTSDDANLRFYGLSYDEWRGIGYDQNSFVADPLFTDPKKRDFSFKSTENAAKINFVPFNQTFGVVGDDWRKIAEDYSYHDCIILYPRVPLTGDESFERGENADIFYRLDRFDNNGNIELTTEKAIDGTHSLKLVSGNENAHPEIKLHLGFTDGNGEISFKVFAAKGSIFWIDFWTGIWVEFRSSKLLYGWETYVGEYEEDKWITITGKCECHTENNTGYFLMIVDGKEYNVTVGEGMRPLEYWRLWLDPTSTVYFDDLHVDIDTPDPPFFDNEVLLEISDDTESSNNEDKKLKPGAIAGIVIAVIVVVVVVVVCIVFVLRKKRYDSDANMNV
ncbi:hypothetical protein TRFO_04403 [Tritrichomonas foetus]|uniref:Right handed beta helix domain-containing protein n=1 Tax=Tritrichomonas foetus TaxID=1144522 RepID=A0A1J4KKI2_9EUKA|nr:hypothetical protein TRFO_04403 [Tritrichomonas foetus]|eukprot:OHT09869.1 hypothetical protein TRFO_04403 [Tritrichomonas foetus]